MPPTRRLGATGIARQSLANAEHRRRGLPATRQRIDRAEPILLTRHRSAGPLLKSVEAGGWKKNLKTSLLFLFVFAAGYGTAAYQTHQYFESKYAEHKHN